MYNFVYDSITHREYFLQACLQLMYYFLAQSPPRIRMSTLTCMKAASRAKT